MDIESFKEVVRSYNKAKREQQCELNRLNEIIEDIEFRLQDVKLQRERNILDSKVAYRKFSKTEDTMFNSYDYNLIVPIIRELNPC
jgi:predicted  nucleic acid-binding Zn-ribbon protein